MWPIAGNNRIPGKKQHIEVRDYLAVYSIMVEETQQQELAAGHTVPTDRKWIDTGAQLAFSFSFSSGTHPREWAAHGQSGVFCFGCPI